METQVSKYSKAKLALSAMAGTIAAFAGMAVCGATDYNMAGPALDATVVTGAKAGVGDAVATIQTTLNNAFLVEVAIMFIGLAVVIGFIMHVLKGHRKV